MAEKKPFVLRLSPAMMAALQRLAADEFRSVNGQIEYVLAEYLRGRGYLGDPPDPAEEEA
jgi:hypothetical protein